MDGHDARGIGREQLGVDAGGRTFRDGDRHGLALPLGRAVLHHGIGYLADVDACGADVDAAPAAHAAFFTEAVLDVDQFVHDAVAHGGSLAARIVPAGITRKASRLAGILDADAAAGLGIQTFLVELETGAGRANGRAARAADAGGRDLFPHRMIEALQQGRADLRKVGQIMEGLAAILFQLDQPGTQGRFGHGTEKDHGLPHKALALVRGAFHPAQIAIQRQHQVKAAAGKGACARGRAKAAFPGRTAVHTHDGDGLAPHGIIDVPVFAQVEIIQIFQSGHITGAHAEDDRRGHGFRTGLGHIGTFVAFPAEQHILITVQDVHRRHGKVGIVEAQALFRDKALQARGPVLLLAGAQHTGA